MSFARHNEPRIFESPPMRCFCCGSLFRTSGCVRGFSCQCDPIKQCWHCHKCQKHCTCQAAEPRKASDFDYIYHPDGSCHQWDCGQQGVVLAYDDFSPEGALWFCSDHWNELEASNILWFEIVEDKRQPL